MQAKETYAYTPVYHVMYVCENGSPLDGFEDFVSLLGKLTDELVDCDLPF